MPALEWQKSSFSNEQDNCVELAAGGRLVRVRESDEPEAVIAAPSARAGALIRSIKMGAFGRLG
jgi:hypothetical protein